MKVNSQLAKDELKPSSSAWSMFPGVKQFLNSAKIHCSEQLEEPKYLVYSVLLFLALFVLPFCCMKNWYYLAEESIDTQPA